MDSDLQIRPVRFSDGEAIREIYRPIVERTWISFESEVPGLAEIHRRIDEVTKVYPWIVGERGGVVVGYGYATAFRARPAYSGTAEVSVYVDAAQRGNGVGRTLLIELLARLAAGDFRRVVAGIALPNEGSVALHESLGFQPVGVFHEVGYRLEDWRDVGFWERAL